MDFERGVVRLYLKASVCRTEIEYVRALWKTVQRTMRRAMRLALSGTLRAPPPSPQPIHTHAHTHTHTRIRTQHSHLHASLHNTLHAHMLTRRTCSTRSARSAHGTKPHMRHNARQATPTPRSHAPQHSTPQQLSAPAAMFFCARTCLQSCSCVLQVALAGSCDVVSW